MDDGQEVKIRLKPERYPLVASRVFDTPLLIEQGKLNTILHVLGPRLGFIGPEMANTAFDYKQADAGYRVHGSVAVLDIMGTLIQRHDFFSKASGFTSYAEIDMMFEDAMDNPNVSQIILNIDSPGGEVAGAFDMADKIFAARGTKKITAIASEMAASAAYLLASSADEIVVPRTGAVGSIGVVTAHVDWSAAMEKKGAAITFIYAGEKKVDGNPYQPLPENVKADIQAEIDKIYGLFISTVARNRGMSEEDVVNTKADMFMGEDAVKAGLADRVGTFQSELTNQVNAHTKGSRPSAVHNQEDRSMDDKTPAITAENVNAARTEGHQAGMAEGRTAGATAERQRIQAILGSDEANGRNEMASHLAFETDMSADAAKALLGKSPKATQANAGSKLDAAMEAARPNVGASSEGGDAAETADQMAARIAGLVNPTTAK